MFYSLPHPISPDDFERLSCDLLNELFKTTNFSMYGRKGQKQFGIDIYSSEFKIIVQCKLRSTKVINAASRNKFIEDVYKDITQILKSKIKFFKIIIATTLSNDTIIQNELDILNMNYGLRIELWTWDKISNYISVNPQLLIKYYPTRRMKVELSVIQMGNKNVYVESKKHKFLYRFKNLKTQNQLPIFDFSFINNSDETVILKSMHLFARYLLIGIGGIPISPAGILKPFGKYAISIKLNKNDICKEQKNTLIFNDPIYAYPLTPFRFQVQGLRPLSSSLLIKFQFNFNNEILKSPDLHFNSNGSEGFKIVYSH